MRLRPLGELSRASCGERGGHLDSAIAPTIMEGYTGLLHWLTGRGLRDCAETAGSRSNRGDDFVV